MLTAHPVLLTELTEEREARTAPYGRQGLAGARRGPADGAAPEPGHKVPDPPPPGPLDPVHPKPQPPPAPAPDREPAPRPGPGSHTAPQPVATGGHGPHTREAGPGGPLYAG
ncbi:hypothetical protein [Streptomyces sp. NPDC048611]|uniref:hypothetical protein n=1 Tax=unclassified Streptomyces TaxID=2593676 RepID=UPI0034214EEB